MLRKLVRNVRRRWFAARWRYVAHVGYRPGPPPNGVRVGAVQLSYGRPHNIDQMLATLLRGQLIDRVILSNDDPSTSIRDFVTHSDERLTILDQTENHGPGMRWRLAHEMLADCDVVITIDDDYFLFPREIERLVRSVIRSPGVPHGVAGMRDGEVFERREAPVDVLYHAYAVTSALVERYMELLSKMPETRQHVERFADDIVISLTGDGPAQVHDVGYLLACPTSTDPAIAVHRRAGFNEARRAVAAEAQRSRSQTSWGSDSSAV